MNRPIAQRTDTGNTPLFTLTTLLRFVLCLSSCLFVFFVDSLPSQAQTPDPAIGYLVAGKEGILLLPPQHIAEDVRSVRWSPDSRTLVATALRIPRLFPFPNNEVAAEATEIKVVVWDRSAQDARTIWSRKSPVQIFLSDSLLWIPNTPIAAQTLQWTEKSVQRQKDGTDQTTLVSRQSLLWIESHRGFVKELPLGPYDSLLVSPKTATAIVHHRDFTVPDSPEALTVLRVDGTAGKSVTLPPKVHVNDTRWSEDGRMLNCLGVQMHPETKSVETAWFAFDPQTGETHRLPKAPEKSKPAVMPTLPLRIKATTHTLQESGTSAVLHPLWLESTVPAEPTTAATDKYEQPRALLCPDGKDGVLAPDLNAVAYTSQGSAWVVTFARLPVEQFRAMRRQALRMVALNSAKQMGLGLLMWAADHDDNLPSGNGLRDELTPYLLNDSLFDGFVYTYNGGPLADIKSPAETELGTVDGPGGVAIIYADGHAKWRNQ